MAFCGTCGKVTWGPLGCRCASSPASTSLRELVERDRAARAEARKAWEAREAARPAPEPVQLALPDHPGAQGVREALKAARKGASS
jgi:hypothetical protein